MCTAISLDFSHHFFVRTLDVDTSYGESVVFTPREFSLGFRYKSASEKHYSVLGVGVVFDNVPLYYDAFNEAGLAVAALNFPEKAVYFKEKTGAVNIASFEFISYILSHSASLSEARELLKRINITDDSFRDDIPATPLHWLISDGGGSLVVESVAEGLRIYEDPFGVLTNAPDFLYHKTRISDFMHVGSENPKNRICKKAKLDYYSGGLGAMGLPGDFSSSSRFVRAVFLKNHASSGGVSEAFRIADNISVPRGAVIKDGGKPFSTVYTAVMDTDAKTYYFTTENSRRIRAVKMKSADLNKNTLSVFSMREKEQIKFIN